MGQSNEALKEISKLTGIDYFTARRILAEGIHDKKSRKMTPPLCKTAGRKAASSRIRSLEVARIVYR